MPAKKAAADAWSSSESPSVTSRGSELLSFVVVVVVGGLGRVEYPLKDDPAEGGI